MSHQVLATPPVLVDLSGAMALLGIRRSAVYRHLKTGKLRAVKAGGRTLFRLADLQAFADALPPFAPSEAD